jgi:hypothetical protein
MVSEPQVVNTLLRWWYSQFRAPKEQSPVEEKAQP